MVVNGGEKCFKWPIAHSLEWLYRLQKGFLEFLGFISDLGIVVLVFIECLILLRFFNRLITRVRLEGVNSAEFWLIIY